MPQPQGERLDSWKEIAAYLGRDLRTVRRWEKDKGLPVHRVPGGERKPIFAYRTEIDAWLHKTEKPADETASFQLQEQQLSANQALVADAPSATIALPHISWWQKPIFILRRVTLAVLLVATLVAIAFGILMKKRGPTKRLDTVILSGDSVQAFGTTGQLLWTYSFDQPLREDDAKDPSRIQIFDRGGGRKQILVMTPFLGAAQTGPSSDVLFSFSSQGELLWRHDFTDTFQFNGNSYSPPWSMGMLGALLVSSNENNPTIWAAVDSALWSPSSLVKLDTDGRLLAKFVNWGHLHVLSHFRNASGSFILAGGINNDCNCAVLAVLNEDQPSGSSPTLEAAEHGSTRFPCENCPAGRPYRYIFFPRSDISDATDTNYTQVAVIVPANDGVQVGIRETNSGMPLGADWEMYQLSQDFVPQTVLFSDHIIPLHKQLEAEGKIVHSVEHCPDLNSPRMVSVWSPDDGWKKVAVKPIKAEATISVPKHQVPGGVKH
jgi:excisionase family DNA binding protein